MFYQLAVKSFTIISITKNLFLGIRHQNPLIEEVYCLLKKDIFFVTSENRAKLLFENRNKRLYYRYITKFFTENYVFYRLFSVFFYFLLHKFHLHNSYTIYKVVTFSLLFLHFIYIKRRP